MKLSASLQSQIESRRQAGDFNLLHGDLLVASLDVWATRLFEEFWDGYGFSGGQLYFDAENCPHPEVLEALSAKAVGLSLGLPDQMQQIGQRGSSYSNYLLDVNDPGVFDLILGSETYLENNTTAHIFSYEYFTSLWEEQAFQAHFANPAARKPSGHRRLRTLVSSWGNNPNWDEFKTFLKLGQIKDGKLELPLYRSVDGQDSLTLVVEAWGKYLPATNYTNQTGLFRDLLKLAKLGLTNFDLTFIFEPGGLFEVETAAVDYTASVRDLADQLRKFMQNKDTVKAGIKTPQIAFLGIPGWESAPFGLVTSQSVEVGELNPERPLYVAAGDVLAETDYAGVYFTDL
ncbi:MAG: hypothetical protein Q4D73_02180 [Actinomycetaceae bacterium]|nr:hypothetical protein [Actinomycetaceae bacterium]